MLHLVYQAGAYGSFYEFVLRQYTQEYFDGDLELKPKHSHAIETNGRMHGYKKYWHAQSMERLLEIPDVPIASIPMFTDPLTVIETVERIRKPGDTVLYIDSRTENEYFYCALMQLKKTHVKTVFDAKLHHFAKNQVEPELYELRECYAHGFKFSEYMIDLPCDWQTVDLNTVMYDTKHAFDYTLLPGIDEFLQEWQNSQQVHYSNFDSIKTYLAGENADLDFDQECIVQSWLLNQGKAIKGFGLNRLPNNINQIEFD